jgi:hypothetical protein
MNFREILNLFVDLTALMLVGVCVTPMNLQQIK